MGDVSADGELVAFVRARVGNEQDLAAGFEDAFDRIGSPDVLADRHAEPHPPEHDRAGRRSRRENAFLVEHAVVRQVHLEPHRLDPASVEQRHRIVEQALLDPRQTDEDRRAAIGGLARQYVAGVPARLLEGGLEDEVLGWVAREVKLRRHHDVGAEGGRFRARLSQTLGIASDVADDGSNLGDGDNEAICGRHGVLILPQVPGARQCAGGSSDP